ncbi:hypothetical protein CDO81_25340 [Roseateles puraquae]|uniref:Peptidase A2 domain-containing protein n=1 Tax=Roseateles puraquae TaxID=431059 RepID=A0A254MYF5_9BURK|nr:hypothetical protein CDO81_25340 [Roseateles puraquae]
MRPLLGPQVGQHGGGQRRGMLQATLQAGAAGAFQGQQVLGGDRAVVQHGAGLAQQRHPLGQLLAPVPGLPGAQLLLHARLLGTVEVKVAVDPPAAQERQLVVGQRQAGAARQAQGQGQGEQGGEALEQLHGGMVAAWHGLVMCEGIPSACRAGRHGRGCRPRPAAARGRPGPVIVAASITPWTSSAPAVPQKELPHTFKLVTIWLVVTVVIFLGIKAWERHREASRFQLAGQTIVLARSPDGHFHWPGRVGNIEVDFLVDTGATVTALPQALAERAGLTPLAAVSTQTAAGATRGFVARADIALDGGVRADRLAVTVLPDLAAPLLGMDVLGRLHFSQKPGELRIDPS